MQAIRQHGSIPFLSWASDSYPVTTDEPNFQLADVVAGAYDTYIRSFAAAAKAWGHPFFLRFNWEMNGDWFPWAESANGNQPGDSVAAWRHVHDIFASVGASNATWVWCPNVGYATNLAARYPGDAYVDWTCLDGYNRAQPWKSFTSLFGASYQLITTSIAPSKPMIVGETGATEAGGSKSWWIADALTVVRTQFPKIKGFVYFDKFGTMDWPIETSSTAQAAFASGIASPAYARNRFASIKTSPIPPLGWRSWR
jgi:beta-mannanase